MRIEEQCPFCRNTTSLEIPDRDYYSFKENGVKALYGKYNAFQREFLISKMCYSCQESVFNQPLPEHEAEWGKQVCDCDMCGSPLWSIKNLDENGNLKCRSCGYVTEL